MVLGMFIKYKLNFLKYIELERHLSKNTQRAYKKDLDQFRDFWNKYDAHKDVKLKDEITKYLIFFHKNNYTKSTISRKISCFRSFNVYLGNIGIKEDLNIKKPKEERRLPAYLTQNEVVEILDKLAVNEMQLKTPYIYKAIFDLLYSTGIRPFELVNIKLEDIDLDNMLIKIRGKGASERIVLFGEKTLTSIYQYINKDRNRESEYLFVNPSGTKFNVRTIQKFMNTLGKSLKVPRRITPITLRHTFATHLLNNGADLRVIQKLLGHSRITTTEIYTHITTTELIKECDKYHPINKLDLLN